ncbi:hypothetical protein [Pedosphaera parvula]|uniref:Lipoprotein n=1 Tax=Pedosphaera parvula (strain Ellin514) TaxID=320771 RepID=B9XA26_PEDPL|nr:hypothetical protein [Pedosphaera parvula]EEF63367.1 hypothetical protein Cflav_PD6002 [Pedosphaera parvula Ellin514]
MNLTPNQPYRKLLPILCLSATLLLQGCVPLATGVITYTAAVNTQEHAAYTDYILITQEKNRELAKSDQSQIPILGRDKWLTQIYKPRMEYSDWVDGYIKTNKTTETIVGYEDWRRTVYPAILAQKQELFEKNANQYKMNRH